MQGQKNLMVQCGATELQVTDATFAGASDFITGKLLKATDKQIDALRKMVRLGLHQGRATQARLKRARPKRLGAWRHKRVVQT